MTSYLQSYVCTRPYFRINRYYSTLLDGSLHRSVGFFNYIEIIQSYTFLLIINNT